MITDLKAPLKDLLDIVGAVSVIELKDNLRLYEFLDQILSHDKNQTLAFKAKKITYLKEHYIDKRKSDYMEDVKRTLTIADQLDKLIATLEWAHPYDMISKFNTDMLSISEHISKKFIQQVLDIIKQVDTSDKLSDVLIRLAMEYTCRSLNENEDRQHDIVFQKVLQTILDRYKADYNDHSLYSARDRHKNICNLFDREDDYSLINITNEQREND